MYPRSVVAWKAKFPGDVLRSYFILKASRMLQLKNGTQHSRKVAEMIKWKQSYWHNLNFFLMVRLSKNIQQLDAASKKVMVIYQSAHQKTKKSVGHTSNNSQNIWLVPRGPTLEHYAEKMWEILPKIGWLLLLYLICVNVNNKEHWMKASQVWSSVKQEVRSN